MIVSAFVGTVPIQRMWNLALCLGGVYCQFLNHSNDEITTYTFLLQYSYKLAYTYEN